MGVVLTNVKRISIRICIRISSPISKTKPKVCGNECAIGVLLRIRRGFNKPLHVQGVPLLRLQGWTMVSEIAATDTIKSQIFYSKSIKNYTKCQIFLT